MASNTINFKGTFDASEILKSLQQIRQQMKQAGASSSLFDGIDKDMEKAQTLIASLTAQLQKGFKNPKEVQSFAKEFDKLDTCLVKIQNGFKEINTAANFNTKTGEINKLTQKLEEATAKQKSYAEAARKAVDSQLDDLNLKEKDIKAIKKEIANQEELERVLKQVGQAREKAAQKTIGDKYQGSATAQAAAKDLTQSALGSTTVGWTDNQGRTTEQTKEIYGKAYLKVLDETLKKGQNAAQAYGAFRKELEKYDIVLEDADESQKAFNADLQRINQIVYDEASPQVKGAITKARNAQNGLGSTDANGDFQLNQTGLGLINNTDVQNHIRNEQLISQATRERQIKQQQGEREAGDAVRRHDQALEEEAQHEKQLSTSVNQATQELYEQSSAAQQVNNSFESMKNTVKMVLSITSAWQAFKNVIRQTFEDVKNLDKAFGSIAMVTSKTVGELWASYGQYAEMANKLGQSTADAIKASALFYQQGLDTAEALSLTEDTMKLATLSGQGFEQATQQMTAALRGFHMEMEEGSHITDVYSELAAHAAADVHGIAYAMSKTASIANNAGMSFENTSAFLTQMIETTQEAPENIGTAMKTIIARFTELKENVAGTADSEFDDLDYNKVDKALKTVGVSLKDTNGQFRNLDDVFLELSSKWDTLDRNSQRYIATIAAGSRQQSRFIAMMENYERTMELVETAQDSAGRSEEQFAKYQDTVEYKLNQLKNSWEQLRVSFLDSDVFKGAIDKLNEFVGKFQDVDLTKLLVMSPAIIMLAKNFVMTFISTIQKTAQSFSKVGTLISDKISKEIEKRKDKFTINIRTKIDDFQQKIKIAEKNLEKLREKADLGVELSLKTGMTGKELVDLSSNDPDAFKNLITSAGFEESQIGNLKGEVYKLESAERQLGVSVNQVSNSIKNNSKDLELHQQALEKEKGKIESASQGFKALGQAITTGIMAAIATGDLDDALSSISMSLHASLLQMSMELATGAAEAFLGGKSIGVALSEGLAATGPGLAIVAIGLAVTALLKHLKKVYDNYQATHKTLEKQIEDLETSLKESQKLLAEAKDQAKEDQEKVKNIEELKKKYEELNAITLKTDEQQEEFNTLIQTIVDEYPEIVTYYNEITGELQIQKELWESILNDAKETAMVSGQNALSSSLDVISSQKELVDLKNQQAKNRINRESWSYAQAEGQEMTNLEYLIYRDISSTIAGAEDIVKEYSLEELENLYKERLDKDSYEDLFQLISSFSPEEQKKTLLGLALDGSENLDLFNQKISESVQSLDNQIRVIDTNTDAEKRELELKEKAAYAQTFQNIFGASSSISQLIANSAITQEAEKQGQDAVKTNFSKEVEWNQLSAELREIFTIKGYNETSYNDLFEKQPGKLQEIYKDYIIAEKTIEMAENLYDKMSEQQKADIDDFYSKIGTMSKTESYNDYKKIYDSLDPELQDSFAEKWKEYASQLRDAKKDLDGYFTDNFLKDSSLDTLNYLKTKMAEIGKDSGEEAAKNYAQSFEDFSNKYNLTTEQQSEFLGLDLQNVTAATYDKYIDTKAKQMAEESGDTIDEVKEKLKEFVELSEEAGQIDITISNERELQEFIDMLKEVRDTAYGQKDTFISAITEQATQGKLSLGEYLKLQKSLLEMGEDVKDYVSFDDSGNAILDNEKLKELYMAKTSEAAEELKIQMQKTDEEIAQTELEIQHCDEILRMIEEQQNYNKVLKNTAELWAFITNNKLTIGDLETIDLDEVRKRKESSEAQLETLKETRKKQDEEYQRALQEDAMYAQDFNTNLDKSLRDATKKIEDAAKKVADAEEKVTEATKKLNEALYGLEEHKNKLDFLYNYQTNLDRITKKANEAKEALEDLKGESATEQLDKYLSGVHSEAVTRKAENQVIQNSIDNYQSVLDTKLAEKIAEINAANPSRNLSTNVSDYYTKVGDRLNVNFQALNAAQLPDDLSDYVEETIEQINKLSDEIEKNDEELKKREKEFLDMQKKARQDYLKLEDQVVSTLKEKYDEEIKATEDKYKAIEEADNEYLDALKEAIDKQRKLRDQANQWDDLQTKEKKLALMQRDTSGANASEINSLEKEIESDREQLLDNAVDNILDSLKEMYDLQKETRDAELEYQKAVLDNAVLVQEANAIIDSWNSADDAVAWFYENTQDLSEMSVAKLEEETEQWRELYDTKTTYMATSQADFESALSTTAEEIQSIVDATSESLTTDADRSLTEITNKVTEAIKSAEKTLEDAIKALEEAKQSYSDATGGGISSSNTSLGTGLGSLNINNNRATISDGEGETYELALGKTSDAASYRGDILVSRTGNVILGTKTAYEILSEGSAESVQQLSKFLYGLPGKTKEEIQKDYPLLKGTYTGPRYASGGLVNYTGPAWVDGTPSKPEAFLSPEDTQRIGAAAQLLSNLPILNSTSNANTTVTSNIGDTAIDIHINIENVSSDYDVDQMIERVKQDIVDVSNPIGSPIILRK